MIQELMIPVEKIVRPIQAPMMQKMRMRSELYSHLHALVEEETARQVTAELALDAALKRFGDLKEIQSQLQSTVPKWNRLISQLDLLYTSRPDETTFQFAWRAASRGAAIITLLHVVLALILVDPSILGLTLMFFVWLGIVWYGCGSFLAIAFASPILSDHDPLNLTRLTLHSVLFGTAAALIEFLTLTVSSYAAAYADGAFVLTVTAFVAGSALFAIVVSLLKLELNQLTNWHALALDD